MELPLRSFARLPSHKQFHRSVEQAVRGFVPPCALCDGQIYLPNADRRRPLEASVAKVSGLECNHSSPIPFLRLIYTQTSRFAVAGVRKTSLPTLRFVSLRSDTMSIVAVDVMRAVQYHLSSARFPGEDPAGEDADGVGGNGPPAAPPAPPLPDVDGAQQAVPRRIGERKQLAVAN